MTDTELLIVRHPETDANVDDRFVGRGETPYTSRGRRQVQLLSEEITAFAPVDVWSSPLARALSVAQVAAQQAAVPLVVDERLLELDFGDAEGMTWAEVQAAGLAFDYSSYDSPVAPGGESRAQIEHRTSSVVDELLQTQGRHAICTHGGVFRAMLVHVLGLAPSAIWAFHIQNGSIARLSVTGRHPMMEEFRVVG